MINITCFGEVLLDIFPKLQKIGGAPLNVATRLQSFKNKVSIISRIGNDDDGKKILKFLKTNKVNVEGIQMDSQFKTGTVKVTLDEKGSASYDIEYPVAWDKIELTEISKTITEASDAFIFGSLVTRDNTSRSTLFELLKFATYKIFDVNLRAPYYTEEVLIRLMNQADFIKFNDDELLEICENLDSKSQNLEQNMLLIAENTNTKSICVTRGKHGAVLLYNDKFYYNKGYEIDVVDTVGAGDSFLASLTDQLLKNKSPQEALNFASAVGAIVASSEGANPEINNKDIRLMIN